jgi:capsular polysaccharide biosynthesis protein
MCPTDSLPLLANQRLSGLARWSVERHVHSCPTCRAELSALQRLSESLKDALPATASPTLDEKILSIRPQSLRDDPTTKRKERSTLMKFGSIPVGACLGLSAAVLITLFQPVTYRAQGKLILVAPPSQSNTPSTNPRTLIEIMNASDIRKNLQDKLQAPLPMLSAHVIEGTAICELTAEGDNPNTVAESVNHWMAITVKWIFSEKAYQKDAKKHGRDFTPTLSGEIRIINEAVTPTEPVSPNKSRNLAIGLVVGMLLGGVFGFIRRS